ncbi:LAGLIDADG family homing endonuclease [Archaeoglobus sp.]
MIDVWREFVENYCEDKIKELVAKYGENGHVKPSIEIDVKNRLRNFLYSRSLEDELERRPDVVINLIKSAVRDICKMYDVYIRDFNVRFVNLPKRLLIKNLNHMFINKFVSVEGIVRKVYEPKPVLKYAVFECPSCGKDYHVEVDGGIVQRPFKCERCGERNLILNVDRSELTDVQKIQIQDLPENLESSEPPKLLDVYLYDDLSGKVLPGDKIIVNGILRIKGGKKFRAELDVYLEANSIEFIDQDVRNIQITEKDKEEIRKLAKRRDIYDLLVQSIAPSIKGYDVIKEAIVLQLFGGITRINPDGTKQRGDIHILLVGDPATSKSQILRAVKQVAPRAILATGYASTGAGLCVAPDSIVFTDSCALEIEKFVEENMNSPVKYNEIAEYSKVKGVKVQTLNDAKVSEKAVEKVWRLKSPAKLVKITTQTGKELITTPETKVMVLEDGRISWKPARDLTKQDYVATVRRLKHKGRAVTTLELLSDLDNLTVYGVKGVVKKLVDVATSKLGITKKELSKMIGTYENSLIHNWVKDNARGNIRMKYLRKLVEIAGVSWEDVAKEVDEVSIRAGKRIMIPVYVDEKLAYLAGLIAGDGCVVSNSDRFIVRFTSSCDELRRRFRELVKSIFGIEARDAKGKVPTVEFSSKIVAHILKKLGIPPSPKSSKLDMTPTLLSLPNEVLAGFVRGLFDCDGCVVVRRNGSSRLKLDTMSKNLAKKLQLALLRFEIVAHLRRRAVKGRTNVINGRDVVGRHDRYTLVIYGENIEKFAKHIGFGNPEKAMKLRKLLEIRRYKKSNPNLDVIPGVGEVINEIKKTYGISIKGFNSNRRNVSKYKLREIVEMLKKYGDKRIKLLEFLADSDTIWERVKNLEIIDSPFDFVYDLTVENTHSFIANGVVVHNTVTAVKAEDGRWTLEAGALVLADRGIALIDEMEKMDKKDRRYMLESLEQQTITVAKAGINATLNTRCSILACANPKRGRFDKHEPIVDQIDLDPPLLSRFDLIFVVLDEPDELRDKEIAKTILTNDTESKKPKIEPEIFKKYVLFARNEIKDIVLTPEAEQRIIDYYIDLRMRSKEQGAIAITARQLEALRRLTEASAKIRLSNVATIEDAERAIRIFEESIKQIAIDPETGKLDIDYAISGVSAVQRDRIAIIKNIVRELESSTPWGAPEEEILEKAENMKIPKDKAVEVLEKLKQKGELYCPRYGYYKIAGYE